jgi:chromosome segregation ATPase
VCCSPEKCHPTCDCHAGFRYRSTAQRDLDAAKQRTKDAKDLAEHWYDKWKEACQWRDMNAETIERTEKDLDTAQQALDAAKQRIEELERERDGWKAKFENRAKGSAEYINRLLIHIENLEHAAVEFLKLEQTYEDCPPWDFFDAADAANLRDALAQSQRVKERRGEWEKG